MERYALDWVLLGVEAEFPLGQQPLAHCHVIKR
jgi:hypothetical protein